MNEAANFNTFFSGECLGELNHLYFACRLRVLVPKQLSSSIHAFYFQPNYSEANWSPVSFIGPLPGLDRKRVTGASAEDQFLGMIQYEMSFENASGISTQHGQSVHSNEKIKRKNRGLGVKKACYPSSDFRPFENDVKLVCLNSVPNHYQWLTWHRLGFFPYPRPPGSGSDSLPRYLKNRWPYRAPRGGARKLSTRPPQSILKMLNLTLNLGSRSGQMPNFNVSL